MSKVRAIRSLIRASGVVNPGQIVDLDAEELKDALKAGAVIQLEQSVPEPQLDEPDVPDADDVDETIELTDDQVEGIIEELVLIDKVSYELANALIDNGFVSLAHVANAEVKDLVPIPGIGEATAVKIIASANTLVGAKG